MLTREDRAVHAAWERVQQQERKGSEKRRREDLRSKRKAQVFPFCGPFSTCTAWSVSLALVARRSPRRLHAQEESPRHLCRSWFCVPARRTTAVCAGHGQRLQHRPSQRVK